MTCGRFHTITWAGSMPNDVPPNGYPCDCGQMQVEHDTCDSCGNQRWILVNSDSLCRTSNDY